MAPSCYDVAASMLLCPEDSIDIMCLEEEEEDVVAPAGKKRGRSPDAAFGADLFPPQTEECVVGLVERELEHMPRADYGDRLRAGGVDLRVRGQAVDWIWKVYTYYNFGPLTAYLAVNYLDRFLSRYELPEGQAWTTQLLSVACLSLAAKMEETYVPRSLDLQIGEERYLFEAKTIQKMELLVLSTLNWRMQAVTPFSYIDYFLDLLNGGNATPRGWLFQSASELILSVARGTVCLGFRPSEIAAAVAAAVVGDVNDADLAKACTHVDKARVLRCQQQLMLHHRRSAMASSSYSPAPSSPVGVLDASCLSCKSDDATTIAAHGSCFHDGSPVTSKRRKISTTGQSAQ
ncbi:hypothetical protein QYE76_031106 [Lolium multiflorum]|uniref:Cyclin N-terminal domain-containing protein n=1 Tax=Lolium multiflorum TaxID=4521 RepID=A0AAD8QR05_LOLMU|nr:hypothetical protein QYE76_031106 [Lolium multiflorum]